MHLAIGHNIPWYWTKLSWKPEIVFNSSKRIIWAYSFATKHKMRRVFALKKERKKSQETEASKFYPIHFMAVAWEEYSFFNFASCESLNVL